MPSQLASSYSNISNTSTKHYNSKGASVPKIAELSFTEEMNNTEVSVRESKNIIKNEIELSSIELNLDKKNNDGVKGKNNDYNLKMEDSEVYNIHK